MRSFHVVGFFRAVSLVALCLLPGFAEANVGDQFGFGVSSARSGTSSPGYDLEWAAYTNPAFLAKPGERQFSFGFSLMYSKTDFSPISGVVVENTFVSDKRREDSVDVAQRDTFGQAIGARVQLVPDWWNLSAGATIFLPLAQTAYVDTGERYTPEYFLYRARTQRPQIIAGLAVNPLDGLYVGGGIQVSLNLTSRADVFLNTNPAKPSSSRFQSSIQPRALPHFGVGYEPQGTFLEGTAWSAVLRTAATSSSYLTLNSGARVFGDNGAFSFGADSYSALYYDPLTVEMALALPHFGWGRLLIQVDYQGWAPFRVPAMSIDNPQTGTCETQPYCSNQVTPSSVFETKFRDIWVPRFAEEVAFGNSILRAGYSYRPSIIASSPVANENYVDPNRHSISLGYSHKFPNLFKNPIRLDASFHVQILEASHITKTAAADSTEDPIGYPGYDVGGTVFGGNLGLVIDF